GHGVLMLQRPGEAHAVWVFWDGPERDFAGWYVNLQEPFRRTPFGYDTQDLELDIWIPAAGGWEWKDADVLEERVREGRYTPAQVEETWAEGRRVAAELEAGRRWWHASWSARRSPSCRSAGTRSSRRTGCGSSPSTSATPRRPRSCTAPTPPARRPRAASTGASTASARGSSSRVRRARRSGSPRCTTPTPASPGSAR